MRFIQSNAGFTIIEAMVAVMILTIGLTGVAGMQLQALRGNNFAGTLSTGSNAAQAWMEWFTGFVNQQNQSTGSFNGKLCGRNFAQISLQDTNFTDSNFTELEIPSATAALLTAFQTKYHFTNADGSNFTSAQVPQPPPPGSRILWRIAANVPAPDFTTLEVSCIYATAFVHSQGPTLRVVLSSNR